MASTYSELLRDPRWQRKRLCVMQRDNFACCDCAAADKTLNVHHCFYEPRRPPWETEDKFLLTLCEECHQSRGSLEADAKRMWAQITSRLEPVDLYMIVEQLAIATSANLESDDVRLIIVAEKVGVLS